MNSSFWPGNQLILMLQTHFQPTADCILKHCVGTVLGHFNDLYKMCATYKLDLTILLHKVIVDLLCSSCELTGSGGRIEALWYWPVQRKGPLCDLMCIFMSFDTAD